MILFNRDVLFVHNPKTAGTSVLACLAASLPGARTAGVVELGTFHPHLPLALRHACAATGNRPHDFKRILAVAREPAARERSMYAFFRALNERDDTAANLNDAAMERWVRLAALLNPDAYLRAMEGELGHCDVWRSREFYRTLTGRPANMAVLSHAHLEADLAAALDGVDLIAPISLPHLNTSESVNVMFDDHSLSLISRSYAWMSEDGVHDA